MTGATASIQKNASGKNATAVERTTISIEPLDLILFAFFTGIGNAIGQPVGRWFYDKFQEHKKHVKSLLNRMQR